MVHCVLHLYMMMRHNTLYYRDLQGLGHRTENPLVLTFPKLQIPITHYKMVYLQGDYILDTLKKVCYICVTYIPVFVRRVPCLTEGVTHYLLHILHSLKITYTWRI